MFQMDAMPDPDPFFGFPGTVIPDDQLDGIYAGSTFMISNGETLGFPPAGEPVFGWPFQNSIVPAGNLTLEWVGRTIASQGQESVTRYDSSFGTLFGHYLSRQGGIVG